MNTRGHISPYLSNSLAIRHEIQRFESVHPSIYAIYDLIEAIPDPLIQQQIREHVVCIEDSFVNSQEWTLSRSVPDLKLGIVGTISSGKSALVHRYLTGSYMQEESPEGGRFKKEVVIDGQSYLLLIRDEGGPPEMQFTHWVDAIIFVFSLENEMSFNAMYTYYAKMAHYRNAAEIPIILVGSQDAISESNPRVIDDSRARKLATDLKRCSYYETCATYGLNVERVFQDACQKVIQGKMSSLTPTNSRPGTPNHAQTVRGYYAQQQQPAAGATAAAKTYDTHSTSSPSTSGSGNLPTTTPSNSSHNIQGHSPPFRETLPSKDSKEGKDLKYDRKHKDRDRDRERAHMQQMKLEQQQAQQQQQQHAHIHSHAYPHGHSHPIPLPVPCPVAPIPPPPEEMLTPPEVLQQVQQQLQRQMREFPGDLPTPGSTPIPSRKNKRAHGVQKSNSFSGAALLHRAQQSQPSPPRPHTQHQANGVPDLPTPQSTPILSRKSKTNKSFISKKDEEKGKAKNGEVNVGSGRVIPIKEGYLYKKSSKPLNKD